MKQSQTGARLKRKITLAVMLIVVVAVVISNAVGLYIYHDRELAAARQNLDELLNLMDAQSYVTNAEELVTQFGQAAPEKRLTKRSPWWQAVRRGGVLQRRCWISLDRS